MKTFTIMITVALFCISLINPNTKIKLEENEIQAGDTIFFNDGPKGNFANFEGKYSRSSFDGKKYTIQIDKVGHLIVSNLKNSKRQSQNEINIIYGQGFVSRKDDTIQIRTKTVYNTFYLIDLKKGIIDSLSKELDMQVLSKNLKNEYCPTRIVNHAQLNIIALPVGVKLKEIYKSFHPEKNIGKFSYFSIIDSKGKRKLYPEGDYILIGGNSQTFLR